VKHGDLSMAETKICRRRCRWKW